MTNKEIETQKSADTYVTNSTQDACQGRIADLEMMVPPQWWKGVFSDSLYLKTDGDVIEDPEITREEVALLESEANLMAIFEQGSYSSEKGLIFNQLTL
jgi:hypothetical protein